MISKAVEFFTLHSSFFTFFALNFMISLIASMKLLALIGIDDVTIILLMTD